MKRAFLKFFEHIGAAAILFWRSILAFREILKVLRASLWVQIDIMATGSLPLIILTAVFSGLVTTVQIAYYGRGYAPMDYIGAAVAKMVMIELGPVLTALIVAGRVGAGIAAEIGTMKVTEQIDALECMGIDPVRFLVLPRILAGIIVLPALTVIADFTAIFASSIAANLNVGVSFYVYFHGVRLFFLPRDFWGGLIKAAVFGWIITFVGAHWGLQSERGATGVGRSTTNSVVTSSLLILISDYFLTILIYQ